MLGAHDWGVVRPRPRVLTRLDPLCLHIRFGTEVPESLVDVLVCSGPGHTRPDLRTDLVSSPWCIRSLKGSLSFLPWTPRERYGGYQ